MKTVPLIALIALFNSLSFPAAFADGGDRAGGGGNVLASTSQEIKDSVEDVRWRLLTFISGASKGQLPDEVKEAFKRFNADHSADPETGKMLTNAQWSIMHTKYNLINAPCVDFEHEQKDSAVSAFKLGAPVCVSLSRLSRIPRETLARTITALAAHELTHQVGLGETAAVQVQLYVIQMYNDDHGKAGVTCYVHEVKDYTGKLTGYLVSFGTQLGSVTGWNFPVEELGEAIQTLRTSLMGLKIGQDGGCSTFVFEDL